MRVSVIAIILLAGLFAAPAAAADQSLTKNVGAILSIRNFTFDDHPAQDIEIKSKMGYPFWGRMMIVSDRFYQLFYISDLKGASQPDRWWGSFPVNP